MTQDSAVAEIYVDESGHDGENLIDGTTTVFAHGSVHMDLDDASELVDYLRKATKAQGPELKAKNIIGSPTLLNYLYGPSGKLVGKTLVYLVDKEYTAVGKIIDMLVEEEANKRGINLYAAGTARQLAHDLYQHGPRALGADDWNDLVSGFTSMMRTKQRKGGAKETVEGFYAKIDKYRLTSGREKVSKVLGMVWQSRAHAEEFQSDLEKGVDMRALDPLETSLYQLALEWYARLKMPISILHDQQTALTKPIIERILVVANNGVPLSAKVHAPKIELVDIKHMDSRTDPRIQLADISAGFCRQVAESALKGTENPENLEQVRHMVHYNSLWAHQPSWELIKPR
ncbi:hypothetical protein CGQ24_09315 [Arthrobacter sp. 7749]|nr:hypothetical protein CGQ24_09315 [Arthrobacter sp. 7749]